MEIEINQPCSALICRLFKPGYFYNEKGFHTASRRVCTLLLDFPLTLNEAVSNVADWAAVFGFHDFSKIKCNLEDLLKEELLKFQPNTDCIITN